MSTLRRWRPRTLLAPGVGPLLGAHRLPGQCELCRRWQQVGGLCADCAPPDTRPRCDGCGLRLAHAGLLCGSCQATPQPFERACCAVDYGHPWDRLIAAFKYHGRVELAVVLAGRLHDGLDAPALAWPDVVIPVPLAPGRLAERGYNQAWELARRVAARVGLRADPHALVRQREAAPQAGLTRAQRQRNLTGAFRVAQPAAVAGQRVALVDDVLTTGATAAAATHALLAASAAAVQVWTLGRTP
jgi:ComF family protein